MKHIAFADRKNDVNTAISFLLSTSERFFCYRCESGHGITAFFHRLCYLLQTTPDVVCLYSELSDNIRSPVHEALKKVVVKNGKLYQNLQMYADESYGEYTQTLVESVAQDFPVFGNTLAHLVEQSKALPIYTGYYPDVIKQLFFDLIKTELSGKKVILFIDNVQFIDNSAMYDILALAEIGHVKVVMSRTGCSNLLEKLLLEIEITNGVRYVDFNEPPVECVQELWKSQMRQISTNDAKVLIRQTKGNIRKIIYSAQFGTLPDTRSQSMLANEILILIYVLQESININDLFSMLADSPTCNFVNIETVSKTIQALVHKGLLSSILQIDGQETFYVRIRAENQHVWNSLIPNKADMLIYQDIVFQYLSRKTVQSIPELIKLFEYASNVSPQRKPYWGRKLLIESLKSGTTISVEWIDSVRKLPEPENQFLCAICLFKMWKYTDALNVLTNTWPHIQKERDAKILYALTLNRCRQHEKAEVLLWELITTSTNMEEKVVLLSIAISNGIHSGNESSARKIVEEYSVSISDSPKYGYFLRNAATLYQGETAAKYWNDALNSFQNVKDEYGELTTITNMARIYIRKGNALYAKESLEQAYTGLMSYGVDQLHIVASNLGVAYLYCGDLPNAKKHLRIARVIAKSIMPKTYIAINECCVMLEEGRPNQALENILALKDEVDKSNLPRLKSRYYLTLAGLFCIQGDYSQAMKALLFSEKFSSSSFSQLRNQIRESCIKKTTSIAIWKTYVAPAFLEYWISNPLSIILDNTLTRKALV